MPNHKTGFLVTHPLLAMSVPELLVPRCSESLKHRGCVTHTFRESRPAVGRHHSISGDNGAMCDLNPALVLSLMSCYCGCHVQNVGLSNHRRHGSVAHGSPGHLSETVSTHIRSLWEAKISGQQLGLQAAELRVWRERAGAFTRGRSGSVCPDCLLTQHGTLHLKTLCYLTQM